RWRDSPLSSTPTALIASTGNTQGIRFRINPPAKASSRANARPVPIGVAACAAVWSSADTCAPGAAVNEVVIGLRGAPPSTAFPPPAAPIGPPPDVGRVNVSVFGG